MIGEIISEEKILVILCRFNVFIIDELVNSVLVKLMLIIVLIKVCELEVGKLKNYVFRFQIIVVSSMEKIIVRLWVDFIFSNKLVGNIWIMVQVMLSLFNNMLKKLKNVVIIIVSCGCMV